MGTLTGTTILDQSGGESNGNKGVLHIPQRSKTRAQPNQSNLVSYPEHL